MKRFWMLAALLVLAATALAGCGTQITAAEIVQHMRDTAAQTTSAHLVLKVSGTMNGAATNAVLGGTHVADMQGDVALELWYQKPNLVKAEILSTSKSEYTGALVLHDGTNLWAYDPKSKIAYKLDTAALRDLAGKANIPGDLQELLANPDVETAIDRVLSLTDYTLGPEEKVGKYSTYRLDLKPKADSPVAGIVPDAKATVWVDKTTWVPVKVTASATQGSGQMEMTTLDLNTTLPATTFQFSLPQGGHVVDLSGMAPKSVTIAEARTTATLAGYHLLEPTYLPAGATLVQVMASRGVMGAGASTIMTYSGGSTAPAFWISQMNGPDRLGAQNLPEKDGQAVTVRGGQGHFASQADKAGTGQTAVLWWKEKGSNLTVAIGGQAAQEELLKIAEGLK